MPRQKRSNLKAFIAAAGLWAASLGCQSSQFNAANLPEDYTAVRSHSVHSISLGQLSDSLSGSDLLHTGDQVTLQIFSGIEESVPIKWTLTVSDRGNIDVPLVGQVHVFNVSPVVAESRIREASISRGFFKDPKVSLSVIEKKKNRVIVAGAVEHPANYDIPIKSSNLLVSLMLAGGFSNSADTLVEIRHPQNLGPMHTASNQQNGISLVSTNHGILSHYELDLLRLNDVPREYLKLHDGSVVTVRQRPERIVRVMGLVRRASAINMPDDQPLTVLEAISEAGDVSTTFANKVLVIRRGPPGKPPVMINTSIREAKNDSQRNIELVSGDIVSVEHTPTTYAIETIRTFFNVGVSAALPL